MKTHSFLLALLLSALVACKQDKQVDDPADSAQAFPTKFVDFVSYEGNPLFQGTGTDTWDQRIRERGYILRDEAGWHMWYTGYRDGEEEMMKLGYATSADGLNWERYPGNPIFDESWTEDMMVLKEGDTWYMFAEGRNDIAHLLTSTDRIHWEDQGSLDVRHVNGEPLKKGDYGPDRKPLPNVEGQPLSAGPYGTPTVWRENGTWYLFYERHDLGIWLATSPDLKVWTNVQDEPVIQMGPEAYDAYGVAVNQIVRHEGLYYAYYHSTAFADWHEWSTNVAVSEDLVHWTKYPGNPILEENKSSGILVHDGEQYRLYTMHDQVQVHYPVGKP